MSANRRLPGPSWLHFFLLGLLLWIANAQWQDWQYRQIEAPSAEFIEQLVEDWSRRHGRLADAADRETIIRRELDERILFREALRLGLHRKDPVVLKRLRQDVEFLRIPAETNEAIQTALDLQLHLGDEVIRRRLLERMRSIGRGPDPQAGEAELLELYASDPEHWLSPERISFRQIFLDQANSASLPGILADLQQTGDFAATARRHGDPFLHGEEFRQLSSRQLDKLFGRDFADEAMRRFRQEQTLDQLWVGPLHSRYGLHLLQALAHQPAQPLQFSQVKKQVAARWRRQHQAERLLHYLEHLRGRYRVIS